MKDSRRLATLQNVPVIESFFVRKTSGQIAVTSSAEASGDRNGDGTASASGGDAAAAAALSATANVCHQGVGDDHQSNDNTLLNIWGDRSEEDMEGRGHVGRHFQPGT